MLRRHEAACGEYGGKIVLLRHDLLFWGRSMHLDSYDHTRVTVNRHDVHGTGDFYFVMSSALAQRYAHLFCLIRGKVRGLRHAHRAGRVPG